MSPVVVYRTSVMLLTTWLLLVGAIHPTKSEVASKQASATMEDMIIALQHQLQDLKDEHKALKDENNQKMEALTAENNQKIESLRGEHRDQLNSIHQAVKQQSDLLNKFTSLSAITMSTIIAFHAQRGGFVGSVSDDTLIPFDIITLDQGGCYDSTSGLFTAPVSGFYLITHEVLAHGDCGTTNVCTGLAVNGSIMSESCSEAYASGGSGLTLRLAAGDTVGILIGSRHPCVSTHATASFNYFSGFLLYQII